MTPSGQTEPSGPLDDDPRARFLTLFSAVLFPMFLAAVDQTVLALATPEIGREFGDVQAVSWLAVGYLLASVIMVPLYGRLADRFGRRRLLIVAVGVFCAGSLACALAPTIGALIAARALQGAGGAGLMSLSQALVGEILQARERARYQGYFATLFATASLVGPLLGGFVVEHAHWRWLFVMNLPLCALAGWRLARLPASPIELDRSGRIDVRGGLMFALCAASTLWLISRHGGVTQLHGWALVAVPLAVLALWLLYWRVERGVDKPYLPLELLRIPVMRQAAGATAAYASASFALIFYLPIYTQTVFRSDAAEAGLLLLPITGGNIVGATLSGRIAAATGRTRELPLAGLLLASACLLVLAFAPPSRLLVALMGAGLGIGLGSVMGITQIITQIRAGPQRLGAAAAVISLSRNFGAALGAAGFGAIALGAARLSGGAAEPAGDPSAFNTAFVVAAIVCAAGAWSSWRLPRDRLPPSVAGGRPAGG